ncbi:hypothetical protein XELAEV_18042156mg [Xenopus laevis]|uniref:Uncharacterized protein n=1 Tax=Xenopus laevis TaxID=8355 RepID=A0A974C3J6_XENLA|nr:hypothetical protein XELAEV_18042156mg [Xenopus laevis]
MSFSDEKNAYGEQNIAACPHCNLEYEMVNTGTIYFNATLIVISSDIIRHRCNFHFIFLTHHIPLRGTTVAQGCFRE